jgi:PAS domain S-box-containing protein
MSDVSDPSSDKLRYEALLSSLGEGLVVNDKSGHITTFNKAAETMLGWSAEEALGKILSDIVRVDFEGDGEAKSSGPSTLYLIRKDNSKFPAAITNSSYIQGASVLGTITLIRDITAETNADKLKNEFMSLVSHQLRTPLSAIKWYSEMLLKGDAGQLLPDQLNYATIVYNSTERLIRLVNSLLNISRIESGRLNIQPEQIDLKKMVHEVINEVKLRYASKKQDLKLTFEETLPILNADPKLVRQIYVNLLTNAAKYSPDESEISINLTVKDENIITEIKDHGFGIPDDEQGRMFEKFYRGSNAVAHVPDGSGLGLYFVKSLLGLSNGKIWFTSKTGVGTSFWFSLPISGIPARKGAVTLND